MLCRVCCSNNKIDTIIVIEIELLHHIFYSVAHYTVEVGKSHKMNERPWNGRKCNAIYYKCHLMRSLKWKIKQRSMIRFARKFEWVICVSKTFIQREIISLKDKSIDWYFLVLNHENCFLRILYHALSWIHRISKNPILFSSSECC